MTRHWAPLDGPERMMTRLRATRDGRARSAADFELPLMALLAILVGIGVVIWLNGQGTGGGEIRRVTARPQLVSPREVLANAAARDQARARAARARARQLQAARALARKRAAAAALAQRSSARGGTQFNDAGAYGNSYDAASPDVSTTTQTYTQQTQPRQPPSQPAASPKPRPKPSGGGGGSFDDSG